MLSTICCCCCSSQSARDPVSMLQSAVQSHEETDDANNFDPNCISACKQILSSINGKQLFSVWGESPRYW